MICAPSWAFSIKGASVVSKPWERASAHPWIQVCRFVTQMAEADSASRGPTHYPRQGCDLHNWFIPNHLTGENYLYLHWKPTFLSTSGQYQNACLKGSPSCHLHACLSSTHLHMHCSLLTFSSPPCGVQVLLSSSTLSSSSSNKLRTVLVLPLAPLSSGDEEENISEGPPASWSDVGKSPSYKQK